MRRRFPDADLVLFGHSHQPLFERGQEVALLSPGSPTWKRRALEPTVARLVVEDGRFDASSGRRDRPQIPAEDHPVRPGEARPVEREPLRSATACERPLNSAIVSPSACGSVRPLGVARGWPRRTRGRGPAPSGRGACPSRPPARPRRYVAAAHLRVLAEAAVADQLAVLQHRVVAVAGVQQVLAFLERTSYVSYGGGWRQVTTAFASSGVIGSMRSGISERGDGVLDQALEQPPLPARHLEAG